MATALDTYQPFDAGAGANVVEANWGDMALYWRSTGVIPGVTNEFEVFADASGMQVKVKTGEAWIQGFWGESTSQKTLAIAVADGSNDRIDRVVLQLDFTNNIINLDVLTGTPAGSPAVPSLTQSSAKWEISLAQVLVAQSVGTINNTDVTQAGERGFSYPYSPDTQPGNNLVVNPGMRFAQEATTIDAGTTPVNNDDTYVLDTYILLSDGNDIVDVTQQSDGDDTHPYYMRLDVETANKKFGIMHPIENKDTSPVFNKSLSLSFRAKTTASKVIDNIRAAIIAWDSTADTITSDVVAAWNASGSDPTLATNWTYENTPANLALREHWEDFRINGVSFNTASSTNLGLFIWVDDDDASVADFLEIQEIKLEVGAHPTPFIYLSVDRDLKQTQRYIQKTYNIDDDPGTVTNDGQIAVNATAVANADNDVSLSWSYPSTMRDEPTITVYSPATGASGKVAMPAGDVNSSTQIGDSSVVVGGTNGAATTGRQMRFHAVADARL